MPVHWSPLPEFQLCIVTGTGRVTRADIEGYVASTIREGAKGYAKLVDMTACTLVFDHDDLESVAQGLVQYGWGARPGPVAIVVNTALNLDMAVLVKQRVGDRPFRIFTSVGPARAWLSSYREAYREIGPDDSFSSVVRPHRGLRVL